MSTDWTLVQPSPWLLIFSMFLFASLCFAKRYVEIVRSAALGRTSVNSRGYEAQDVPLVLAVGLGTGMTSIAIMVLYIIFDAFKRTFYGDTIWLWAMPLIMFLWICRIWLMAVRDKLNDDPVAFALRDPLRTRIQIEAGSARRNGRGIFMMLPINPPNSERRDFFKKAAAAVIGALVGIFPVLAELTVILDPLRRKSQQEVSV